EDPVRAGRGRRAGRGGQGRDPRRGPAVDPAVLRADGRGQVRRQRHDRRRPQVGLRRGHRVPAAVWRACRRRARRGPADFRHAVPARHRVRVPWRPAGDDARGDGRRADGADRAGRARAGRAAELARALRRRAVGRGRGAVHRRAARGAHQRRGGRSRSRRRRRARPSRGGPRPDRRRTDPGGVDGRTRHRRRRAQRQRRHRGSSAGQGPRGQQARRADRRDRAVPGLAARPGQPHRGGDRQRARRADAHAGVGDAPEDGGVPASSAWRGAERQCHRWAGPALAAAGDLHRRGRRHDGGGRL
ncbi:MAG: Acetylglutamate kinase, partial [uncultured Nocardioidaceae bacterium]